MKKILSLLVVALLVVFAYGCKNSEENQTENDTTVNEDVSKQVKEFSALYDLDEYSEYLTSQGVMYNDDYIIEEYVLKGNEKHSLIAIEKKAKEDSEGQPIYVLVGKLEYDLPENSGWSINFVQKDGVEQKNYIAVYEYEKDVDFFTKIIKVWKFDIQTGTFEEISTEGITVYNEFSGV